MEEGREEGVMGRREGEEKGDGWMDVPPSEFQTLSCCHFRRFSCHCCNFMKCRDVAGGILFNNKDKNCYG